MSALGETLRVLDEVFAAQAIEWYLFGAQAVAVRGAPRATQDVDVTIFVDRTGIHGLVNALLDQGIRHRYPEIADELLESGLVLPLVHESGMEIDIVLAHSGLEELTKQRATPLWIEGVEVPVAHATDLVVMKVLAGRGKDLDDVRSLLASGDVHLAEAKDLLRQLEEALDHQGLLPSLEAALRDIEADP